jgi:hypothetical protein
VALGPAGGEPEARAQGITKWFWGLLAATVVGLLLILGRLLKSQPGEPS